MYNFNMTKNREQELLINCNFSELQRFIFTNLAQSKTRKEVYSLVKEKYGFSQSLTDKHIKKIAEKINCVENGSSLFTYKIYEHIFPNGKKYVGVCQNCQDRWCGGNGYINNDEMYKDIKKYGWDNIEHKILLEVKDGSLAYKIERVLIEELELTQNGYNRL